MSALPGRRDWAEASLLLAGLGAVGVVVQATTGVLGPFEPGLGLERAGLMAAALVFPALSEEVLFRGPLLWLRSGAAAALLLAAFVAWHPVQAWLWRPELRELFTSLPFLALAACLGAATTLSAWRSRNLLPPVFIHWSVVALWIVGWGGPAPTVLTE